MAGPAPSPEVVVATVSKANGQDNKQVLEILGQYADLSAAEQDNAWPLFVAKVFSLVFGDKAFVRGSSDYELQRQLPWSTNCWLSPLIILTPSSSQHVAAALSLCVLFNIKFSVRGGGRLNHSGANSNDGGVVISLAEFNQVRLSDDQSTADIGVGLRWLDVYKALEPHGLAVAGGRVPHVGVPGLILGGGISFQNSQYGIGAMGVVNYEVVLADSSILNANANENQDLFWALKGGALISVHLPSVTLLQSSDKVIQESIWCEARVYPPTAYDALAAALIQYHDAIESDDKATLIWYANESAILLVLVYCSPDADANENKPAIFAPFLSIPAVTSLVAPAVRTVYELGQGIADVVSTEAKVYEFRTMSSRPSLKVYKAVEQARAEQAAALKGIEGLDITTVFQPMSSLAMKKSANTPLGLDPVGQQCAFFQPLPSPPP
ncbi:FAD-binding oxidoreductase [Aspergillus mulundensis]|uniref:FAD-binding PCMH-type domain-containing protein n=1 Tax=Aspergillus mulundensis TaxID=1810919 RepID=A0A3D8R950_9EURO|nr:Uncharacterized protein DSM5745_08094 [Aspergillus mulundensis]RDW70583.1 Uncharacterized protein DSM5745_08094 [Aspergillus mulundensis]